MSKFKYGDTVIPKVAKTYYIGPLSSEIVPGEEGEVIDSLCDEITVLFNGIIELVYCEDELELVNPRSESELKISIAKLREVLDKMADTDNMVVESVDYIINRIKCEL